MKKYESILKRVEQVEYKLGISYAKTSGKLYKYMWIINLIAVVYLCLVNILVILSTALNMIAGGNRVFSIQTIILIGISTVLEIVAVCFEKSRLKITGGILSIIPIPYLMYVFIKSCYSYGEGFLNLKSIFYTRHLPSLALITVASAIMLFISAREKIKTNSSYKRILTNLYDNYKNERARDNLEVSDEDWEEFITNYSPKNNI